MDITRMRLNEELVIGGIINGYPIENVLFEISAQHFMHQDLRIIFEKLLRLHEEGKEINVVNCLNANIDISPVLKLGRPISEFHDVQIYVQEVRKESSRLQFCDITSHYAKKVNEEMLLVEDTVIDMMNDLNSLVSKINKDFPSWDLEMDLYLAEAEENKNRQQIIFSGLPELDECLKSVNGARLLFVAARPGIGKTALGTQLVTMSARKQKKVAFFTLENTKAQLYEIFLAREFGINRTRLAVNDLSELKAYQNASKLMEDFKQYEIFLYDRMTRLTEILSTIILLRCKKQIDFAVIDYIGLIEGDERFNETKTDYLSRISRSLKNLTIRLNMPIVVMAQLNRDCSKTNRAPNLSDLRDCGSFEQDADVVLMLHQPKSENELLPPHVKLTEIHAEKNRVGPVSTQGVYYFNGRTQTFTESAHPRDFKVIPNTYV